MSLFNQKTILKNLPKNIDIPLEHIAVLTKWKELIENGTLRKLNEVEVHASFTNQIMCKVLGYNMVGQTDIYTVAREYTVARGQVDLAIGKFTGDKKSDVVIAPFELKGANANLDAVMSGRHKTPVQQAFEYARDIKGAKWVLVSNYVEIRLYSVSDTSLVYECFNIVDLLEPTEYGKFQLLLNADNFLNNKASLLLDDSEIEDKDISNQLYSDYKKLRLNLITTLIKDNPEIEAIKLVSASQKILDRILFISFAEDKGLIPDNCIKNAFAHADPYNPKPIYENFKGLFTAIDKGNATLDISKYNGGLFAADDFLNSLLVTDELCLQFKLMADYDFDSDVSVNVLGHIFEQSISDLELILESISAGKPLPIEDSKSKSVKGKRKKSGVVYTPEAITRFIVENTLGKHLRENFEKIFLNFGSYSKTGEVRWNKKKNSEINFWYSWQEELKNIKIVDPACGSGAFIVAAFEYIYPEYKRVNERISELSGQSTFLDLNKEILNYNLFGVDINEESIEITKLSLWLVTAEKGKPLETLDDNFLVGNSLGFENPAPNSDFYWKGNFPEVFNQGGFDIVLGNPPYVRQELLAEYKEWLFENSSVYHGVIDLYAYFFELGINILKDNGKLAFISSNTFFKTSSGKSLRRFISENTMIEDIIDFGDLQVFEGVTTYTAIISLKKSKVKEQHEIKISKIHDTLPDDLINYFNNHFVKLKQTSLSVIGWSLEDQAVLDLKLKITANHKTIEEKFGSPNRGVLTGCNDVFIINLETQKKLIEEDFKSSEIIKPFLEGKDFKKWHCQPRELYIIMARRGINIDNYPAIKTYLSQFRARLEPKPKDWNVKEYGKWEGRKSGSYQWYELQDAVAYYKSFENPKIQYGHFCPEPLFHYNTNDAYSNDKSYILPTNDLFLFGLLNSDIYWFLIKSMCPVKQGGFYEVRSQYIETLPVPKKPDNEKISNLAIKIQELVEQRYSVETKFKRRLKDLCPPESIFKITKALDSWWELDFSSFQKEIKKSFKGSISLAERSDWEDYFESELKKRETLMLSVNELESELNVNVFNLFELTDEEINLIRKNK
jgi:hypothetical protein